MQQGGSHWGRLWLILWVFVLGTDRSARPIISTDIWYFAHIGMGLFYIPNDLWEINFYLSYLASDEAAPLSAVTTLYYYYYYYSNPNPTHRIICLATCRTMAWLSQPISSPFSYPSASHIQISSFITHAHSFAHSPTFSTINIVVALCVVLSSTYSGLYSVQYDS